MPEFLSYKFEDTPAFISTFDEMPLWSAYFGMLMLKHVELKPGMTVVDIGSGAGFPLLELAERLGPASKCYGLDPWKNANERAKEKIRQYDIKNAEVIEGSAERIPFDDNSIDMIVSNLGINNFDNRANVFTECKRVLKPGGKLSLTTNMNGHWQEFYDVFEATLEQEAPQLIEQLTAHQEHRGNTATIAALYTNAGLNVCKVVEDKCTMNFLDGTAFLNHHFVKLGWLGSWKELVPEDLQVTVFSRLESNLNALAHSKGSLSLTVPMAYMEGEKA